MMSRTFGVGVVGTGIMGRRMLAALHQHTRFRTRVLWDPGAAALRAAVATMPDTRAARGLEELVDDPGIDVVYVASPPATHRDVVAATLVAGRACFCEKPLSADIDAAQSICDLVSRSGTPFAVNFPFASAPASRRLIELVRDGRLGAVRSATITARFAQWPRPWQAGASPWLSGPREGGFTREVLSHFVFLALRMFGPATVADVQLGREPGQAETWLRARLVHVNTSVIIDAAVAGDVADANRFEVIGANGEAALVDWSRLLCEGRLSDRVDATPATLDRLVRLLEDETDHGLATAGEGLAVVRCIETMLSD
jgi:predicted dehydrogenase